MSPKEITQDLQERAALDCLPTSITIVDLSQGLLTTEDLSIDGDEVEEIKVVIRLRPPFEREKNPNV